MDKSLPLKIMSLKRIVWKEGSSFGKWFFIVFFFFLEKRIFLTPLKKMDISLRLKR